MSAEPTRLFADTQPGLQTDAEITPSYVDMARAIAAICAVRALLMIAVLTGSAIWLYCAWAPERERLFVAVAYSLVFVLPQVGLFWRRG